PTSAAPGAPLPPYTTLFRSRRPALRRAGEGGVDVRGEVGSDVLRHLETCGRVGQVDGDVCAGHCSDGRADGGVEVCSGTELCGRDRKSTRLNSSHVKSSYAV